MTEIHIRPLLWWHQKWAWHLLSFECVVGWCGPTSATTSGSHITSVIVSQSGRVPLVLSDHTTTSEFARQVEELDVSTVLLEAQRRKRGSQEPLWRPDPSFSGTDNNTDIRITPTITRILPPILGLLNLSSFQTWQQIFFFKKMKHSNTVC